jgi:hypothetical protein
MKQTIPALSAASSPVVSFQSEPKTFHVAQRQK